MKILYILNLTMFDYNKKYIVILGSVIIGGLISYDIYQKKIHKKYSKKQLTDNETMNLCNPNVKVKPVIKYPMTHNDVMDLGNPNVKVKHTKKPTMPKSQPPIRFSLQQTKKVTPQIVLTQIMAENEIPVPNKVKHNTILKFLDDINNNNIDISECNTKHNDTSSDDDNPIIIMARS
jgi:hypothetical protein